MYHVDCYKAHLLPKCSFCNKSIEGEYVGYKRKAYHKNCYETHIALKCMICGKSINGKYARDYWGNVYHQEHRKELPACEYCMRLIGKTLTGGGRTYKDGRQICGLCLPSAVHTGEEAGALYGKIKEQLTRWGIRINFKHPLFLVNSKELARISGKRVDFNHQGFTRREAKFVDNKLVAFKIEVFILTGLPAMHFISTAAHELMHVWQHLNVKKELAPDVCEGSSNYASYLVLSLHKNREAEYIIHTMLKSKERIYGRGFQKIYDLVERNSPAHWLHFLQGDI